jgi:hypothetical protein
MTDRSNAARSPSRRGFYAVSLALSLTLAAPAPANGQVLAAAAGGAGGLVAGIYTTAAVYVARARTGRFLYSVDEVLELRPANLPAFAGPVVGAAVGWHSSAALGGAAIWSSVGFLGGGAVGAGAGHVIWGTDEGRWAGAIIGSAAGLLLGATFGARSRWRDEQGEPSGTDVAVSIPTPFEE